MRNIAFEKRSYLRNDAQKIEIEDENLEFKNGLAIAKAHVHCYTLESSFSSYKPKTYTYFCEGLINENYEEAFFAKYENESAKYFMFCEENKKIMRFGTNDYIVEYLQKIQGKMEKRYTHLKVIDGKIFRIKENIKDFSLTSMEDVVILNHQFYIVSASKTYGPAFTYLKEDSNKPGEFIVVDKIVAPENDVFPMIDIITYRMNDHFQLTSFVYSLLEGNSPVFTECSDCNKIKEERIESLQRKQKLFQQEIPVTIENNIISSTSIPNLVICNNQFFYYSIKKPYGPKFLLLKEDKNKLGEFIVVDRIVVPSTNSPFSNPIIETLTFRMNHKFQVLDVPKSLIEDGETYFSVNNYDKMREERIQQLIEKRRMFQENFYSLNNTFKR